VFVIPQVQFRPGKRDAWVVYALLALNLVVFLFTMGSSDVLVEYGLVPGDFKAIQLLTSMFLHVGWIHLLGNLFFLYMFGESVEQSLGHGKTLLLYLGSGLAGGLFHLIASPNSYGPMIGASGAICGLTGAYAILFRREYVYLRAFFFYFQVWAGEVPAMWGVGVWLIEQLVYGALTSMLGIEGGTAYSAHIVGLAVGVGVGLFVARRRGAPAAAASRAPPTTTCTRCGGEARFAVDDLYRCKKCGTWLRAGDRAAPRVVPRA
jgi:membrane associated rhomboid family serine protease